ncbi:MAG: TonB-dependent receptor [Sulfurospirillaceae bacterium]|nr:TonB-dependent receptor [Sulfurospirillaceae bacterium]
MKSPKGLRGRYFSLAAIMAFSSATTLCAQTQSYVDNNDALTQKEKKESLKEEEEKTLALVEAPAVVVSKKIKINEVDAPFASEIYTKKEIQRSRSQDIYEFLNTQTSVFTTPASGNIFAQKIDLRGFGIEDGYQNVVLTLNGRRLNNIDMSPQLLSTISMDSIKQIEILKGSGSVEYGDGASAGVINILTEDFEGVTLKGYAGSNELLFGSVGAGIKEKNFSLSAYLEDYSNGGQKQIATDGQRDESDNTNKGFNTTFSPIDALTLNLGKSFTKVDAFYANALTLNEYKTDPNTIPAPSWGSPYGHQKYDTEVLTYGTNYKLSEQFTLDVQGSSEDKISQYVGGTKYTYDNDAQNVKLSYKQGGLKALAGVQNGDVKRQTNTTTMTTKDNTALFAKTDYAFGDSTFSLGARAEKVEYSYEKGAVFLEKKKHLSAYDIGYNYKLDRLSSVFINYNTSFQAPDVDRFFDAFSNTFNGFIEPMEAKTLNVGYSYLGYPNKFKISAFYSKIDNEIYYDNTIGFWGANSNLDETEKMGFELYDKYNLLHNLYISGNYAFVDTKILKEGDGSFNGREIPGVSKHNIKLSLGYNPDYRTFLTLSQNFKSKAYATSDFDGNFGKMDSFNTTDFSATYKYKKYELFAKINNIFDVKNAYFADSGSLGVYPVSYERNFMLGFKAKF